MAETLMDDPFAPTQRSGVLFLENPGNEEKLPVRSRCILQGTFILEGYSSVIGTKHIATIDCVWHGFHAIDIDCIEFIDIFENTSELTTVCFDFVIRQ